MPTLPLAWDPEMFRDMIYSHENTESVQWLVSRHSPLYSRQTGDAGTQDKWIRVENPTDTQWRCIVQHSRQTRTFQAVGSIVSTSISVTFMPDEMNIMADDMIIPMGDDSSKGITPSTTVITRRESVVRGWSVQQISGATLTATGENVTITGVDATQLFTTSDVIEARGERIRISSVNSSSSITLETAPSATWNGLPFGKCSDKLMFNPVAQLYVATSGSSVWNPYTDMTIGSDGASVQWSGLSNSPTAGQEYSLDYAYYPSYVVLDDEGYRRHITGGVQLPVTIQCALWVPEGLDE